MKRLLKIVATSLVLFGMGAAPAMAGDHGRDRGHYGNDRSYRGHDRGPSHSQRDYRDRGNYRADHRYRPAPRREVYVRSYASPRVVYRPAPRPYWVRGGRYYGTGYAPTYVVNDWGYYGLRAPPRGYYWRRSDTGDFLLVALATGIITDIILNH